MARFVQLFTATVAAAALSVIGCEGNACVDGDGHVGWVHCDNGEGPLNSTGETCCGGTAWCFHRAVAPQQDIGLLARDTCSDADEVCIPRVLSTPGYVPPSCRSVDDAEGRCLSTCIPSVAARASEIPQATCDPGSLCAPCYDPITAAPTGACATSSHDSPREPPKLFASCCAGEGLCVPSRSVPDEQRPNVNRDTCAGSGDLCVPPSFTDPAYVPPACRSLDGAEGRCLSPCFPSVAARASQLPRDVCDAGTLCAPCYDPLTGKPTGACTTSSHDMPRDPPVTFATCCGGAGRCVPPSEVPASEANLLAQGDCTRADDVCVPSPFTDPAYVPPACRSVAGAEGRCMSPCVPSVAARAEQLPQDDCAAGTLCAPCYDPITGKSTGACSTSPHDAPAEPPTVFATCCGGVGRCVPPSVVPSGDASQLVREDCPGSTDLCIPGAFTDPSYVPPSCRSLDDAEGRCLSPCIPAVTRREAQLPASTCDTGTLCAPCYDPVTGASTGACSVSSHDAPKEAPTLFPSCCGGAARCVPAGEVPAGDRSRVARGSCAATDDLCVPTDLVDPQFVPPTCRSIDNAEGRCLSTCLPSVQARAAQVPQATCTTGQLCVPCYDPTTGRSTGACSISPQDSPKEAPVGFASCCSGAGLCVPQSIVPAGDRAQAQRDSCASTTDLCVPTPMVDPNYVPPSCRSIDGAEGRCLSTCLPSVAARGSEIPQATCGNGTRCAPCFDPLSGQSTGACSTSTNDAPKEAPHVLPKCCSDGSTDRGTCVPSSLVPPSEAGNVSQDTCPSTTYSCVPTPKVANPAYAFPSCTATILLVSSPGVCLPDCLPAVSGTSGLVLSSAGCGTHEKCVPCVNPLTGASTGACN